MSAVFDAVESAFGGVDVVVNTAGIMVLAPIATFDLADLDRMHRTNIRGTFVVSRQAAHTVRPARRDRQLLDPCGPHPAADLGAYVASKGAVEGLTLIRGAPITRRRTTLRGQPPHVRVQRSVGSTKSARERQGQARSAAAQALKVAPKQ